MSRRLTASEIEAIISNRGSPYQELRSDFILEEYPQTAKRLIKLVDQYWDAKDKLKALADKEQEKRDAK